MFSVIFVVDHVDVAFGERLFETQRTLRAQRVKSSNITQPKIAQKIDEPRSTRRAQSLGIKNLRVLSDLRGRSCGRSVWREII